MPIPRILQGKLALPVIGAPLFIVAGPELVIARCKAGSSAPSLRSMRGPRSARGLDPA
jgi:NAD(P)H-dependent flavin oxidoreductase YrpB (nitropropane dioxygenase family)